MIVFQITIVLVCFFLLLTIRGLIKAQEAMLEWAQLTQTWMDKVHEYYVKHAKENQ